MPKIKASIEGRLALAQVAIDNTIADPELSAALAAYGYTAERLRQGAALRDTARALYQRQKGEYGNLLAAGDARDAAQRQAQDTYMRHVKVARVALKDDRGALQTLNLATQRRRALAGWLAQAQQFYANALAEPNILVRLAAFGITQAMLADSQRQIDAVAASDAIRKHRKGAAQDATRQRDAAMASLDTWISDFLKVARVALQDRPQLVEKLGVAAHRRRSSRPAAPAIAPAAPMPAAVTITAGAESVAAPAEATILSIAERRNGRPEIKGRRG